jgi:hypothetical protein
MGATGTALALGATRMSALEHPPLRAIRAHRAHGTDTLHQTVAPTTASSSTGLDASHARTASGPTPRQELPATQAARKSSAHIPKRLATQTRTATGTLL